MRAATRAVLRWWHQPLGGKTSECARCVDFADFFSVQLNYSESRKNMHDEHCWRLLARKGNLDADLGPFTPIFYVGKVKNVERVAMFMNTLCHFLIFFDSKWTVRICVLHMCNCSFCSVYICVTPRKRNFWHQSNKNRGDLAECMARSLISKHQIIYAIACFNTKFSLVIDCRDEPQRCLNSPLLLP